MTTAYFDVPASNTPSLRYARPPHVQSEGIAFRTIRLIWLTAQFVSRKPVTFVDYRRRFGVSLRSFRRDIALLRKAGLYIETVAYATTGCSTSRSTTMRRSMGNVVPFKAPETFDRFAIDWNRAARSEYEQRVREDFLTHEKACGANGLVSLVLLAIVARRQGAVAEDLATAADFAEVILAMQLRKHRDDVLAAIDERLREEGPTP